MPIFTRYYKNTLQEIGDFDVVLFQICRGIGEPIIMSMYEEFGKVVAKIKWCSFICLIVYSSTSMFVYSVSCTVKKNVELG